MIILSCFLSPIRAKENTGDCDGWQKTLAAKRGTVTALWDDIEPFIYINKSGQLAGVEFEIMESLKSYVKVKYGVDLEVHWQRAGSFDNIFNKVRASKCNGLFGWSYYSITPERKQEVEFSLPYMPDVNVLVTNNLEPMYASPKEFTGRLREMHAFTQPNTTMETDVKTLQKNFYPKLPITYALNDYEIMRSVASHNNSFGYVPLSVYIVALQKDIRVKRQQVLSSHRQGFAAVMPLQSDWKPLMDEYFSSALFRMKAGAIIAKYLGTEVKDLVFEDSLLMHGTATDLVSLEKEIVTKRLMDAVVQVEQQSALRNILLVLFGSGVLLSIVLYSRFRTRKMLNAQLEQQKQQIEQMNQLLKMKILQARLNPHFLFNSLNSIQYFIAGGDKKLSLQYISRFAAFLRKVINYGDELSIQVHDEASLLREYLWLEHCRFFDKFEYEITVHPSASEASILPFLTHSLVESALYKGILHLTNGHKGKLEIEFTKENGNLVVTISDNGLSRRISQLIENKKSHTNGDEQMLMRRIELFNAHHQRKITTSAEELEEKHIATLAVPQPLFDLIETK
ncbi:MAG: histidine kinase [Pseudobacter sp.]|uniref:histidine kinase n=1 Tax=Pseudobacter sp. TaxID=2045420 RepID=UPI003F7D8949